MEMRLLRVCVLALLSVASGGTVKVQKKRATKNAELDESKLPPLADVLEELGISEDSEMLESKGVYETKQLCKWSRSDVSINGMEAGFSTRSVRR